MVRALEPAPARGEMPPPRPRRCPVAAVWLLGAVLALSGPLPARGAYTDAKPLHFKGKFDPWKVLGLPRAQHLPANDVLRKAFKKGALKWHPDRCKRTTPTEECEARMEDISLAQEVLTDERKLQQWEAWDEDRRTGGPRPEGGGRSKPFGQPKSGGAEGGGRDGGRAGGMPGGGGAHSGRASGGPRRNQGRPPPAPKPPPPPPPPSPRPSPRPKKPPKDSAWRVVSSQKSKGIGGAQTEHITRERDLPGTPMVQVETLEKTCYKAQVQCQEKVLERRRRRKEADEL